jgi:DNA-binding transcriptional MerR regulator
MGEIRYIISDASKKIDVEQHTLRYWEEELDLHILRNEMGHRYYREEDIEILKAVKILKENGYQLRAIKMLIPQIQKINHFDISQLDMIQKEWNNNQMDCIKEENHLNVIAMQETEWDKKKQGMLVEDQPEKLDQFKEIMGTLIRSVLQENTEIMSDSISEAVSSSVIKEMDYLLRMKEEREEERYKQFDRTLRELQNSRSESAVSKAVRKKKRFFKK